MSEPKPGDKLKATVRLLPKNDRVEPIEFESFDTYTAPTKAELEAIVREKIPVSVRTGALTLEKRERGWVAVMTTPKACDSIMSFAERGGPPDDIRCSLVSGEHTYVEDGVRIHKNPKRDAMWRDDTKKQGPLPSVGRTVHYYGELSNNVPGRTLKDTGPFAALVVDVGPGPTTVTLKITDRQGRDHVRANVEYGDPGWLWPARV